MKLLTLRAGIQFQKHRIEWCDEAVTEISALSAVSGSHKEEDTL